MNIEVAYCWRPFVDQQLNARGLNKCCRGYTREYSYDSNTPVKIQSSQFGIRSVGRVRGERSE